MTGGLLGNEHVRRSITTQSKEIDEGFIDDFKIKLHWISQHGNLKVGFVHMRYVPFSHVHILMHIVKALVTCREKFCFLGWRPCNDQLQSTINITHIDSVGKAITMSWRWLIRWCGAAG